MESLDVKGKIFGLPKRRSDVLAKASGEDANAVAPELQHFFWHFFSVKTSQTMEKVEFFLGRKNEKTPRFSGFLSFGCTAQLS